MVEADWTRVTDEELVRRAQQVPESARAREAAAALFTRYTARIYGICFCYTGDRERARDLSQEILLKAYEKLKDFERRGRFAAWIYAIARNRCRNEARRAGIKPDDSIDAQDIGDPKPDPVEELIQKSDEAALLSLIRRCLSKEEQMVLWLRCVEKIPHSTLNALTGTDLASGARAVLQRARRRLRAAMESTSELEGTF